MSSSSLFDTLYTSSYSSRYGPGSASITSPDSLSSSRSSYVPSYSSYSSSYSSSGYSGSGKRYSSGSSATSLGKYQSYLDDLNLSGYRRRGSSDYSTASTSSYVPSTTSYRTSSYLSDSSRLRNYETPNYDRWRSRYQNKDAETLSASTSSSSAISRDVPIRRQFGSRFLRDEAVPSSSSKDDDFLNTSGVSKTTQDYLNRYGRGSSMIPLTSYSRSSTLGRYFPSGVAEKLSGYDVQDVRGDGGCYYRCLSLYFTGSEENYMKYRREVMAYIRDHLDSYKTMIKSELKSSSTNDYFSRKTRSDLQDWAETTEIIATCCVYNINVHVLAFVPGRKSGWEWLHFDPSIGTGKPSCATKDIYLYNQGSVHFQLCIPK